jgi:hypothetical protein
LLDLRELRRGQVDEVNAVGHPLEPDIPDRCQIVPPRMLFEEDGDAALDRHFAAHPEDRGADIVIFKFCDDEELADESQDCDRPAGPPCEEP